jgi:putative DNA methylase
MIHKKKLIEVALPLEAINVASAKEKSIRHGHPSTLHLWWARRPLAAARAVIFAQMVDDPSGHPDIFRTEQAQEKERQRLFRIIEQLVRWENTTNEHVLQQARDEIWQSWRYTCAENASAPRAKELFDRHKLPAFHDPFAGGGALPLEAQRLGLASYASDLNPVAVLINKAMIEIPPKFAGRPPINPPSRGQKTLLTRDWSGAQGLAEDVHYYGQWMRDEAEKRIGYLYPKVVITRELADERPDLKAYVGKKVNVIAWLWARTVKSPNPAFAHVDVPLASTFILSTKPGKQAFIKPVIKDDSYSFTVIAGTPNEVESAQNGTKLARGANFRCLISGSPIDGDYIKAEGKAGRIGARMMAIVAEGDRGRLYLSPTPEMESIANEATPGWTPEVVISGSTQYLGIKPYGIVQFDQLFTNRQLVALATFSDLVTEAQEQALADGLAAGLTDDRTHLAIGGSGAVAYAEAIAVYLAISVDKAADYWSTICSWHSSKELIRNTFGRQALPMMWDYAETNPFSESTGNASSGIDWAMKVLHALPTTPAGVAIQADAQTQTTSIDRIVSTDPPYFDNVPYADLSDFFYVWMRRSLARVFPELFATVAVPKAEELVAFAYRHKSKEDAEAFFLQGMTHAMHRLADQTHPGFPVTIYYAFKQAESDGAEGIASTGWETFLSAVLRAGFAITGTWPMRTELQNRMRGMESNALASSIVLVCRPRGGDAPSGTRGDLVNALKAELPGALTLLQRGNIAPVDLAQAAIGPGMAIYSRYEKVLDAKGKPMNVRDALALVNETLDNALAEQESIFDADSRWALAWFEQSGFAEGEYGVAETLSKAKNTSVAGMVAAGFLSSSRGKVRLLKPAELPGDWDPATDTRLTAWEVVHHLIRALETGGGEIAAAALVAQLGTKAENARELAYRLYSLCERKKRAADAMSYNGLVLSWPEITRLARGGDQLSATQTALFAETEE